MKGRKPPLERLAMSGLCVWTSIPGNGTACLEDGVSDGGLAECVEAEDGGRGAGDLDPARTITAGHK